MPSFRVKCKVDKGEGIEFHTLYAKDQDNAEAAERSAKFFCVLERLWTFYGAEEVTRL